MMDQVLRFVVHRIHVAIWDDLLIFADPIYFNITSILYFASSVGCLAPIINSRPEGTIMF